MKNGYASEGDAVVFVADTAENVLDALKAVLNVHKKQ